MRARRAIALRKAVAESEAAMGGTPRGNGAANASGGQFLLRLLHILGLGFI